MHTFTVISFIFPHLPMCGYAASAHQETMSTQLLLKQPLKDEKGVMYLYMTPFLKTLKTHKLLNSRLWKDSMIKHLWQDIFFR